MNILNMLAIPTFNDKELEELSISKMLYEVIDMSEDKRINKTTRKRNIISDIGDLLIEHFNLEDVKIKFTDSVEIDENYLYIECLDNSINHIVEDMVRKCLYLYFKNIDKRRNLLSEGDYKLIKLSMLNNKEEIIKVLQDQIINELFINTDYNYNFDRVKINKSMIANLKIENNERNNGLLNMCKKYDIYSDLMPGQIRAVFTCLSSDIFNKCNVKEKIHLLNLVYNYFNYHKEDKYSKYKKVVNPNFTNIDGLNLILEDLSYKDKNNHLNKIRNEKLLEDIKSGFKYIIKNETNKNMIDNLDDVSLSNINKR